MNLDKKSYRFKFPKKSNPLHLGDGSAKSWNLVANYYDTSLLRSMTASSSGRYAGQYALYTQQPLGRGVCQRQLSGVYLLCEAVNVAKSRIAITEDTTKIEDDGYLVEMSRYARKMYSQWTAVSMK
ncbi:MAG: CotH kinase family protein [Ruminococcus callidus]